MEKQRSTWFITRDFAHVLSESRAFGTAEAEAELRKTAKACGGCLEIALPETIVSGERIPVPTRLVDVVAIQRGTERPNEVVIIQGHIDSRVSDVMNATADAPGASAAPGAHVNSIWTAVSQNP